MMRLTLNVTLLLLSFLAILSAGAAAQDDSAKPLFNGKDGIAEVPLRLEYVRVNTLRLVPGTFSVDTASFSIEGWASEPPPNKPQLARLLVVRRWRLGTLADALTFPIKRSDVLGPMPFPGWDAVASIGDKSRWVGDRQVVFVKGNNVVSVYVNGSGRSYTEKIARQVAETL